MTQAAIISPNGDSGKKPPMTVTGAGDDSLLLSLVIDDPEVVTDLKKRDEGRPRNSFAVSALRIGILALRQAQGSMDAEALKHEGQHTHLQPQPRTSIARNRHRSQHCLSPQAVFRPQKRPLYRTGRTACP
jgi:hypothetical protein